METSLDRQIMDREGRREMSRLLRLTIATCVGLLVCVPEPASAWWDGGHKIVAQIAYDELTPAERAWVISLIERNPTHAELFVDKLREELGEAVDPETRNRWYFSQASIWADLVREKKGHARAEEFNVLYNRDSRHYADAPIFARPEDKAALPEHAGEPVLVWSRNMDASAELNSLQMLAKAYTEIPDPAISAEERALDLLWIFHIIGDMHQPCHCAQLFVFPSLPEGDRGANQIFVFGLRAKSHGARSDALHAFWDGLFNKETNTHADILQRTAVAKSWAPQWERAQKDAAITDPQTWWREGIALAESEVYDPLLREITAAKARPHPYGGDRPDVVWLNLTDAAMEAYAQRAHHIGKQQVLTAGLRLAASLKELYRLSDPQ